MRRAWRSVPSLLKTPNLTRGADHNAVVAKRRDPEQAIHDRKYAVQCDKTTEFPAAHAARFYPAG